MKKPLLLLLGAGALAASLAGCGKGDAPAPAKPAAAPSAPAASSDPMSIVLDAELAARVRVEELSTAKVYETIKIAGRLDVNQYRTARIGAPITGRITQIDVQVGQQVRQGDVLAQISSPELTQAQLAFLRAHSQEQLLTRGVERAQLLLAADVIGSAELQRRESELSVARAEKRAASDQLRTLGLSERRVQRLEETGQIMSTAPIAATMSGTVIDRKIAQGQVVQPSDALFTVSDLSHIWALAEVPEQDARFVQLGQRVEVEIPALEGMRLAGKVAFVADVVNPETRTVRISVDLDNSARQLKPSMLMTMLIEGKVAERQVVPAAAVVRESNADHVFVETGKDTFKLKRVELGPERDGRRPLLKPMPDGSRVVVDGAFHLNNVRVQRATSGS